MTETADRLDTLMEAARKGDRVAYRDFLREAAERLRRFYARRIGADADLEDLVQECLIALHEKRATLDPGRPVGPWMYALARYKLADHWRRRGRVAPLPDADAPHGQEGADAVLDVSSLIRRLPPAQAEAIGLTKLDGLTAGEAGDRLGIGLSAVKVRVHRGMARLRRLVNEDEE